MNAMKIVVNRNRNTRTVINSDFVQQVIVVDNHSQHRSYAVADSASWERDTSSLREIFRRQRNNSRRQRNRLGNKYIAGRQLAHKKEQKARYRRRKRIKRDLAITREKFARLSVTISRDNNSKDERIENSVEPSSTIQLREPVLQFSRSYEEPSSSSAGATCAISTEKADLSSESLIKIFKCRMCPNYAVPEVYECLDGHLICEECYLISSHCTLCPNKNFDESRMCNDFRRTHSMAKIASLLTFPCRWMGRGCLECVGPGDWRNHVDLCRYAEVQLNPLAYSASQVSSSSDIDSQENVVEP